MKKCKCGRKVKVTLEDVLLELFKAGLVMTFSDKNKYELNPNKKA